MMTSRPTIALFALTLLAAAAAPVAAQQQRPPTWRDRGENTESLAPAIRVVHDVRYGDHADQVYDVYAGDRMVNAPVIFMVHGGGWRRGDKAAESVVRNKVNRWVPQGYLLISANYRMLPDATPDLQAEDVARAIGHAQESARRWGADPARFILMGHSAGGHLVALVASHRALLDRYRVKRPSGIALLDSAALDVEELMRKRHLPLFDDAFGDDPAAWRRVSPYHVIDRSLPPLLGVCALRREDSCAQMRKFAQKAASFGTRTQVEQIDLSHREINDELGIESAYTHAVEQWLATLDGGMPRPPDSRGEPPWRGQRQ